MQGLQWGVILAMWWADTGLVAGHTSEHKIHNIVLYPDKHSWCKTTEIKQIVTYPGCNSVEIDNNVCVGACFSYGIPRTSPSAPGEIITPYCDSCQPTNYTWKEIKLTCEGSSDEEEEGVVEMTKKVQVISNCTCDSCSKGLEHQSDHNKHTESVQADVPELMSLMMEHNRQRHKEVEEDEEEEQESTQIVTKLPPLNERQDFDNAIEVDEVKEKEEEHQKEEEDKIEIVHVNHRDSQGVHLVEGPHHSLVIKPDVVPEHHTHSSPVRHQNSEEDEEISPQLHNAFKEHDHEEYPDQLAVESRKDFTEGAAHVLAVPELIYKEHTIASTEDEEQTNNKEREEKIHHGNHHSRTGEKVERNEERHHHHGEGHHNRHFQTTSRKDDSNKGVKIVDVSHHQLTPAVDGSQFSYVVKNEGEED